jgi:hypothetical protein
MQAFPGFPLRAQVDLQLMQGDVDQLAIGLPTQRSLVQKQQ